MIVGGHVHLYSRVKQIDKFFVPHEPDLNSNGEVIFSPDTYKGPIQLIVGHPGTLHYFVGPSANPHLENPTIAKVISLSYILTCLGQ